MEAYNMSKLFKRIATMANNLAFRAHAALVNQSGDFYISDGVKVIIAVVLGALLLGAMTLIFNNTVIPKITEVINDLFN